MEFDAGIVTRSLVLRINSRHILKTPHVYAAGLRFSQGSLAGKQPPGGLH